MEIVLIVVGQVFGVAMAIYSGVIVARYMSFDAAINRARSIVFNLEHDWEYRQLVEKVPDPESPTGARSIYMSPSVAGNRVMMQLMEIGLEMKEMGHWPAAKQLDRIAMEVDALREEFLEQAELMPVGAIREMTANIADWHRRLSTLRPTTWQILQPWAHRRYEHMSCVETNQLTGEWREVEAQQPKTIFNEPQFKI